jgi:hypothetical protein
MSALVISCLTSEEVRKQVLQNATNQACSPKCRETCKWALTAMHICRHHLHASDREEPTT